MSNTLGGGSAVLPVLECNPAGLCGYIFDFVFKLHQSFPFSTCHSICRQIP